MIRNEKIDFDKFTGLYKEWSVRRRIYFRLEHRKGNPRLIALDLRYYL
ncbi:MAG: hypothetical protein ACI9FN_003727 [Saprospiraceae bacterium]|jgi:hypothetical protein